MTENKDQILGPEQAEEVWNLVQETGEAVRSVRSATNEARSTTDGARTGVMSTLSDETNYMAENSETVDGL